ncbi:MAG: hypothetical protein AAF360_11730, partial [Pseudomonadota bacterium]
MVAMIELADAFLRGAGFWAHGVLALRFALMRPVTVNTAAATTLCLCLMVYIALSAPAFPEECVPGCAFLRAATSAVPFLLWFVVFAIFDDGLRPRWWHAFAFAAIVAPAFIDDIAPLRPLVVAGLYGHILYVAVVTAASDLVETRIVFRRAFFGMAAITGLVITVVEVIYGPEAPSPALMAAQATALALLPSAFLFWSHRMSTDLFFQLPRSAPASAAAQADPLLAALTKAMEDEVWRTEGLTIGALAARLGAPEHQVRALINRRLGHRNFSGFINARRIAAAAAALEDPARRNAQILTIAHEVGFASLGPFNRAF